MTLMQGIQQKEFIVGFLLIRYVGMLFQYPEWQQFYTSTGLAKKV